MRGTTRIMWKVIMIIEQGNNIQQRIITPHRSIILRLCLKYTKRRSQRGGCQRETTSKPVSQAAGHKEEPTLPVPRRPQLEPDLL